MERKILWRKEKVPQASQARLAAHFVGHLLRGQSPQSEKASSLCGKVTSAAKSEGHSPFAITVLLKNLPYFFKKSLHRLDFRHLFCYNS